MILCTLTNKDSSFSRTAATQLSALYHSHAVQQADSSAPSGDGKRFKYMMLRATIAYRNVLHCTPEGHCGARAVASDVMDAS